MITVAFKEKFIRNSINDSFLFDKWQNNTFENLSSGRWNLVRPFFQPTLSGTVEMDNERKTWEQGGNQIDFDVLFNNVEKIEYVEFITWEEVFARENELRSDLKTKFDLHKHLYSAENPLRSRSGPPFNPFALTYTGIFTFKTLEGFIDNYDTYHAEHLYTSLPHKDNLKYSLIIDGIEYDYFPLPNQITSILKN